MYCALYIFYKLNPETNEVVADSVEVMEFSSPQTENSVTREKRKDGYRTQRVNRLIFNLISSVKDLPVSI